MLYQVLGYHVGHELVGLVVSLPTLEAQAERQGLGYILGLGFFHGEEPNVRT